jgi:hypothetical protein
MRGATFHGNKFASMTDSTYFLVTIDTEEEWDWSAGRPVRNPAVSNIRRLPRFQQLCDRYAIRPTYFCNLAVLENRESRATIQEIAAAEGVEIGMHIHPWNTPPLVGESQPSVRSTFLHNLPADAIRAKFNSVYDAFLQMGMRPSSFRGGRYSSGGVVQECLLERQFVADCSVVPFTHWPDEGAPDYRHRDLFPQRLDQPCADGKALWEIPLTLAYSRPPFRLWQRCFDVIESTFLKRLRLIGLAERIGLVRKVWLNFEIADPYDWTSFWNLLRRLGVPYICFTVHSSSLAAGPGPYTRSQADEDRIFGQIETVFAALRREREFAPLTASELAQHLEQQYACAGNQSTR